MTEQQSPGNQGAALVDTTGNQCRSRCVIQNAQVAPLPDQPQSDIGDKLLASINVKVTMF